MSNASFDTETDALASLLVADDDITYCKVLAAALNKRGFTVHTAHDVQSAFTIAERVLPEFALVDLKMPGESGLTLIQKLKALNSHMRIVLLTGYASIATAVEAIKLGAVHYLIKPVDADEIIHAFGRNDGNTNVPIEEQRLSVERLEWEYIHKALKDSGGNISAAARSLDMHRRTLQRKLQKRPAMR